MPETRSITVAGVGTARSAPNRCTISLSLTAFRDTAPEAITAVSETANAAVNALRGQGVDPSDIRTQNVFLQDWLDDPSRGRQVVARVATYMFSVRRVSLGQAADVISTLTDVAGEALKINGIAMVSEDDEAALDIARRDAVADARRRAEQLAEASGVRLGRVLSVEEAGGPSAIRFADGRSHGIAMSASLPLEPGSDAIHVRVAMTFEIADD